MSPQDQDKTPEQLTSEQASEVIRAIHDVECEEAESAPSAEATDS